MCPSDQPPGYLNVADLPDNTAGGKMIEPTDVEDRGKMKKIGITGKMVKGMKY